MKTAYSYQRWSTLAQGHEARTSRKRQGDSASEWINSHGKGEYLLSEQVFVDAGKSGFKGEHIKKDDYGKAKGELSRFIQLVEDRTIKRGSILLIDSYDRFSRLPVRKSLDLFLEVIDSGIGLVFTGSYEKRVIDTDLLNKEPNVLAFITGEMIRSYAESAEKSRKIKAAKLLKLERMKAGEIVAHNNIPKYFSFDKIKSRYEHNSNTVTVKELIKGILSGKSLYSMADDLNARQVKTFRRGFEWSGNSIRQILKNRTLVGEYLNNKGFVPAITDEDTFNKVQIILNNNSKFRGKTGNLINIFRGICVCECGKTMSVASGAYKGVSYRYLKCSVGGIGKHSPCKHKKLIRLEEMEVAFFNHFLNKHPYELINGDEQTELKEIRKEIAAKQIELNRFTSDIEVTVNTMGIVNLPELQQKLVKLEGERTKVKNEMDTLNLKLSMIQTAPQNQREVMLRITEDGVSEPKIVYADTLERVEAGLKDNEARKQARLMLPTLIGKVTVNTTKGQFYVFNRMDKLIFKSHPQSSNRNRSDRWKESLKVWDKRKVAGGRVIKVKRK